MTFSRRNVAEVLRYRAADNGSAHAFTFLADGERPEVRLTYSELHAQANAIAAELQNLGLAPGDRAMLLYPPGLEFVSAFFGCLYAGVVAVPCYPPHPSQLARTLPRMLGIMSDAEVSVVLTTSSLEEGRELLVHHAPQLRTLPWVSTDAIPPQANDFRIDAGVTGDSLAFLQYTSGSTASPKGVMVSHANLIHNLSYADHVAENDQTSISVSWLPVIHDMGLIGGVLGPLFSGYPGYLMAPAAFLQQPIRWLRAITRYRATNSGGPNFAYELCTRKITDAQSADLDLQSWKVAFNGAEPIRRETLTAFHQRFQGAGFSWRSFYPVYGLAESTLLVSSGRREYEARFFPADPKQFAKGRIADCEPASSSRNLVGCGTAAFGTRVKIVDPVTLHERDNDTIGEIWVSSPSVAKGYWRRPAETAVTFNAYLENGEGPFLRTGDLGVMREGDVVVTGRLKDLLIVRGLKHYPQDIEITAESQHHALRPGCSAAFSIESGGEETIAIALEIDPRQLFSGGVSPDSELGEIIGAVKRRVAECHGIVLSSISLLKVGGLPKTSSGKVRRQACKAAFLDNALDEFTRWTVDILPLPLSCGGEITHSVLRTGT